MLEDLSIERDDGVASMIYWLHRFGAPLSRVVPVSISYLIASIIAPIVFVLWREKRTTTIQNMTCVLGDEASPRQVRMYALRAFINYAKYLVDMLRLEGLSLPDLEKIIVVNGWEHFTGAMDEGKGLIFVGGHIGNSDLAAALLASRGFPVHVITEPLQPPRWDALVQAARQAVGMRVIPMSASAIRFLRVLREKEILALLIDRPVEDQGVDVQFFGRTVKVPQGAAALALRADANILGAYILRSGNRYVANISPAISAPTTGDATADLEQLTQAIFNWLQGVIRQHPDQWFMFRPMWRAPSEQ
jgi:lauroyl/myristoyl acyltransferase